jgi:pimeloyl-ACP methyl ester carboxylesterase
MRQLVRLAGGSAVAGNELMYNLKRRPAAPARARRSERKGPRVNWALFEQLDDVRRAQGALLDAVGLAPVETRYQFAHREPGVALRRYEGGDQDTPPVLIVPAPIKRPYIWDLAPEVSAVRRCLSIGARVWLVDWQPAPPEFGIEDYAERLILACLDAAGAERAILVAHSLGGLLAAIFAALHPQRVQGLALLASPLHFGADAPVFSALVAGVDPESLPDSLPGSFLSTASFRAAPDTFGAARAADADRARGPLRARRARDRRTACRAVAARRPAPVRGRSPLPARAAGQCLADGRSRRKPRQDRPRVRARGRRFAPARRAPRRPRGPCAPLAADRALDRADTAWLAAPWRRSPPLPVRRRRRFVRATGPAGSSDRRCSRPGGSPAPRW